MKQRMFPPHDPHGRRARLLVEDPDPALGVSEFRRFQDAGFEVALCEGPQGDSGGCPLVRGERCELAEQADIVLMGPGIGSCRADIAAAHHRHRRDLPVVVELSRDAAGRCPAGCIPAATPTSVDGQIRTLWRVLDRWSDPRPRPLPPATAG